MKENTVIADLETKVLTYLCECSKAYTKTMYKDLFVKPTYKLSLNKFRKFMYELEKLGKVTREDCNTLSIWVIK